MSTEEYLEICSDKYQVVEQRLQDTLESLLDLLKPYVKSNYKEHAVVGGRVKSPESLLEKLARQDKKRTWDDIKDKVALKVILPSRTDVTRFVSEVQGDFPAWSIDFDEKVLPAEKMGYTSTHLDCTSSEYEESDGVPLHFEIQVRTMVQDAWYVNDHALNYKSGHKVLPEDFKRGVLRLSILTELIDEEVERLQSEKLRLSAAEPLKAFEVLANSFDNSLGRAFNTHAVSELFQTLFEDLYTVAEKENFPNLISAYLEDNKQSFIAIVERHSSGSRSYTPHRDWLYSDPITLLIAERAMSNVVKFNRRVENDDLKWLLAPMISEFGIQY